MIRANGSRVFLVIAALVLGIGSAPGCGGINTLPTLDEQVKAAWSEVLNQFQRRADLIPNLVETVKGYATQEREVLTQVTEARAKASQIKVDASTVTDPAKFKEYQDAQNALTGALGRLLVTVERYPDLKSNQNFLALQSQLEGTENRISVARRDYIDSVRTYGAQDIPRSHLGIDALPKLQADGDFYSSRRCEAGTAGQVLTPSRYTHGGLLQMVHQSCSPGTRNLWAVLSSA